MPVFKTKPVDAGGGVYKIKPTLNGEGGGSTGGGSIFDNWIMPTKIVANMLQDAYEAQQITKVDLLPLLNKYKEVYKDENVLYYEILLHRLEGFSEYDNEVVLKITINKAGAFLGVYNTYDHLVYSTEPVTFQEGAPVEEIIELVCNSVSSEDLSNLAEEFINIVSSMAGTGPNYVQRNVCIELMNQNEWTEYPISMKDLFAVFGITLD